MTKAENIFASLDGVLDNNEVVRTRAVCVATVDAPSMTGKKASVVVNLMWKVHSANDDVGLWTFHCIIHEEALRRKSLKTDREMEVVDKTVDFVYARDMRPIVNLTIFFMIKQLAMAYTIPLKSDG